MEINGYTYHGQLQVDCEVVEAFYVDDLPAVVESLEQQP